MIWLRKLAAWYLQRSVRGYMPGGNGEGTVEWVMLYGQGWQLTCTRKRVEWNRSLNGIPKDRDEMAKLVDAVVPHDKEKEVPRRIRVRQRHPEGVGFGMVGILMKFLKYIRCFLLPELLEKVMLFQCLRPK